MDHAGRIGRCNYAKVSPSMTVHLSCHFKDIAVLCAEKLQPYLRQFDRFSVRNSTTAARQQQLVAYKPGSLGPKQDFDSF